MFQLPFSSPIERNAPAAESQVESNLQSHREAWAQWISGSVMRVCGAVSLALAGIWLVFLPQIQVLFYAALILLLMLGAGLYLFFQRRNRTSTGLFFLNGLCLVVVLMSPLLIPSLLPVVGVTALTGILLAILLLGDRGSRWVVGAYVLVYMVDVVLVAILNWRPLPALDSAAELWITGAVSMVGILTAIHIVRLIILGLERQFRRAQHLNLQLEHQIQLVNATQEALQQERNLLRTLIDSVPAYVYIKDAQSRFVDANIETAHQMGVATANALMGKTDFDFYTAQLAGKYFADEQAMIQSGQPLLSIEEPTVDQSTGRDGWLLTTKAPIRNECGVVTGLVGVGLDITERKEAEAQAFALAAEQQRSRLLREFIRDVSHDLRTPMTLISTSAYLVSKTTDPAKRMVYSQRIEEQISRLKLLLDSFVELAELEQRTASLQLQPIDLVELVKTIIERNQPAMTVKHQHLDYCGELPSAYVLGDLSALNTAISQVLVNAIHYTPAEGKITVRIYSEDDTGVIEVADTGIGIPAGALPHIFESFYRVDSARSSASGGAGLGLAISKKIVELLQGRIEVQSELGVGSVFKVYLPLQP